MNDFGYFENLLENFKKVNETQSENIRKAANGVLKALPNMQWMVFFLSQ